MVHVAENRLNVAIAGEEKAIADVGQYQSAVDRWESEVKRLSGLVGQGVVDKQVLSESEKQLKSNVSRATLPRPASPRPPHWCKSACADVAKSRIDVDAARAKAKVAQADVQRYAAMVSYTKLTAPYDGIVVVRNANTGDFVQPAGGDQSVTPDPAGQPTGAARRCLSWLAPIWCACLSTFPKSMPTMCRKARKHTCTCRRWKTPISMPRSRARPGRSTCARRTLRAEIDLPNSDSRLLPGMYAYAMATIKRTDVLALPVRAVSQVGNQNFCYRLEDGKAVRTIIQTGPSDGKFIEVANKQVNNAWQPFSGDEQIIVGDLAEISDGQAVEVVSSIPENQG